MASVARVGIGYDIHRLASGRRLVLGSVPIPAEKGLVGHSDADVVLHALADALLGAGGLPDLGELFPDSDPAYADADSSQLLARVVSMVRQRGYRPVNVDLVVHAEAPRLGAYKQAIRRAIAERLGLELEAVNVKAKTAEQLGAIGTGQAIACTAIVGLGRSQGQ